MRRGDLKSGNPSRGDALTFAASFAGVAPLGPIAAFIPNDPLFEFQWHLLNTGQSGGTPGIDINVTEVWNDYTGSGVVIGIIDDGVQYDHPDLSANYDTTLDHDARDGDDDAAPGTSSDIHGTTVAGVIAALDRPQKYAIFNLGESDNVPLPRFIASLESAFNKTANVKEVPLPSSDVPRTLADISKAQQLLGYNPTTKIEDGIKKFADWYLDWYLPNFE